MSNAVIKEILEPWATTALDNAKTQHLIALDKARKQLEAEFAATVDSLREENCIKAQAHSEQYFNTAVDALKATNLADIAAQKAELDEMKEADIAAYKHQCKIGAEERKEKIHSGPIPDPSVSSKPTPASRTNRPKMRVDPITRPASRARPRSLSRSLSRSHAPSPVSLSPGRSPDMTTPRASPSVELPPTHALTEPALVLQPPPTNVLVGPPSDSFEERMMLVDTTALVAVEYPRAASSFKPYGPPNTQAPIAPTTIPSPSPSTSSSTEPPTDAVMAAIRALGSQLSSQISALSSRVGELEQPKPAQPYSPSILATLWQPNPTHATCPLANFQPDLPDPCLTTRQVDYIWGMDEADDFDSQPLDYVSAQEAHAAQLDQDAIVAASIPTAIRDMWSRFEGLDPHIENLSPSQFSSLNKFYAFFDQFMSENFAPGTDPEVSKEFELSFISHYRSHLQVLAFTKVSGPRPGGAAKPPPTNPPPAPAFTAPRPLIPRCPPSTPPITTLNEPVAPPPPASPLPWKVMGKGNKPRSYAAAAASEPYQPTSTNTRPSSDNRARNLSNSQLDNMSRDQLVRAYETQFSAKVNAPNASKLSLKITYKRALEHETSTIRPEATKPTQPQTQAPNPPRPRARPVVTTEFTVTRDPASRTLQGPYC